MSELSKALIFAYRTNVDRYQRMLKTHLADNEREFIERRLAEDEQALLEIIQKTALAKRPNAA